MLFKLFGAFRISVATRVAYALLLLVNSIIAWLMLSGWAIKQLERSSFGYLHIACPNGECYGLLAVYRISLALGIFHAVLASLLTGVNSSHDNRARLQNKYDNPHYHSLYITRSISPDVFSSLLFYADISLFLVPLLGFATLLTWLLR